MWPILQHHEPDDFALATGETHSVRSFVEAAVRRFGIFREGEGVEGGPRTQEQPGTDPNRQTFVSGRTSAPMIRSRENVADPVVVCILMRTQLS